jgi:hypothetical protein
MRPLRKKHTDEEQSCEPATDDDRQQAAEPSLRFVHPGHGRRILCLTLATVRIVPDWAVRSAAHPLRRPSDPVGATIPGLVGYSSQIAIPGIRGR